MRERVSRIPGLGPRRPEVGAGRGRGRGPVGARPDSLSAALGVRCFPSDVAGGEDPLGSKGTGTWVL